MKKIFLMLVLMMIVAAFAACDLDEGKTAAGDAQDSAAGQTEAQNSTADQGEQPADNAGMEDDKDLMEDQSVSGERIPFEQISAENLGEDVQDAVDDSRAESGYEVLTVGDENYLVVYAGQKSTSGYGVEITDIVDCEGTTIIKAVVTSASEDMMVADVITYPWGIVRLQSELSGTVTLKLVDSQDITGDKPQE